MGKPQELRQLAGKSVIITGASRGIGRATAKRFAGSGANVTLVARSAAQIAELAEDIGTQAVACAGDITSFADMVRVAAAAVDSFGQIDAVIANAGAIEPIGHIADVDPADWSRAVDVNLKGVFNIVQACLPEMLGRGGGTVVLVSSGAAHEPIEGWSAYCSAKAGAAMFIRCLHKEYGSRNIRALSLSPGTVATDMQRAIRESGINPVSQMEWSEHIPPEWPAKALAWMCTPKADAYLGDEVRLRDTSIRKQIGLIE